MHLLFPGGWNKTHHHKFNTMTAYLTKLCIALCLLTTLNACVFGQSNPDSREAQQKTNVEKQSISKVLRENGHLPVAERVALYYRLKKENPDGYNFDNEDELTMYGYSLLWAGLVEEAIPIFKLIVDQFPNSSNPYDSLGEGYMAHGDTELAIANYEKSLALNPDNFNAEDQLERLRNPGKKPETPAEKFARVFSPEAYKADLDQLGKTLMAVHPNALKFISKADFLKIIEAKKALVNAQTTYAEFAWHCNEIIASVHCSHTDKGRFFPEHQMLPMSLQFPLQTRWVNDRLYVIDPLNNAGKVAIKDEILRINGMAVSEIVADIYRHISAQGYIETSKRHVFNTWATGMIPYALQFPKTYTIQVKGKAKVISLNKAESVKDPVEDTSIKFCKDNLCFEVQGDKKTAILTVASFNYYPWGNLDVFVKFMDNTFDEIRKLGIQNLIIDVRFNGGGSQHSSIHLLKYLTNKPFSYYKTAEFEGKAGPIEGEDIQIPFENGFKGNLYFMIDGHGNSTTGHFMSIVKALKLGTIVGEELGSNHFCSAGQKICRLANTKLEYYVANNTHVSFTASQDDAAGVLPDHYVTQSIDDYLKKVDVVKEYTLRLVKK